MDYGENILRKYGWKEGKGLGKDEGGISKPLKCGLKFDRSGIGYQEKLSKEENDQWWIKMFNQAASNISSSSNNAEGDKQKKKLKSDEESKPSFKTLTDEELFAACGGRTAHKAARHGIRLNGKLNRISQQETKNLVDDTATEQAVLERVEGNKIKQSNSSRLFEDEEKISIDGSDPFNITKTKKSKKSKKTNHETVVSVDEIEVERNTDDITEILRHSATCSKSKKNNKKRKRDNE